MKIILITTLLNVAVLVANIIFNTIAKKKLPKWEYFKEGIRFFNAKGEVTIEYDKPLKK